MSQTAKELKQELLETKREMRRLGIRQTSCFNGGLSQAEYRCNSRLFELKVLLSKSQKQGDA